MLNELELVRESATEDQVVFPVFVVRTDLFHNESLEILIDSDTLDKTVDLRALRVEVDFAFLVEHSLLTIGAEIEEFVLVNKELGGPWRRHVEDILFLLGS